MEIAVNTKGARSGYYKNVFKGDSDAYKIGVLNNCTYTFFITGSKVSFIKPQVTNYSENDVINDKAEWVEVDTELQGNTKTFTINKTAVSFIYIKSSAGLEYTVSLRICEV